MKKSKIIIAVLLLFVLGITTTFANNLLIPQSGSITGGQVSTNLASTSQSVATAVCYEQIIVFVGRAKLSFYNQVDAQLQSANLNSNSLNYLFRVYRDAKTNIQDTTLDLLSRQPEKEKNPDANAACQLYVSQQLNEMQNVLVESYKTYLEQKRGVILFEKYDQLNQELEKIDEDFRSVKDNLGKFNDLLPCYATQCIRR